MVESVKADNLKEIVVTFNHEVAKDSVSAEAFRLNKQPVDQELVPVLKEDGKTVVITLAKALTNQAQYKLTAASLVAAEDAAVKLAKTETEFVSLDAMMPKVQNIEFSGPKSLTITFSEPIARAGKVAIESGNLKLTANIAGTEVGSNKVTVPVYSTFVDGKEYKVEIKDFEDFAGYKNLVKSTALTYAKDTTVPTAEVVAATQEYVIVQFSKPVEGLSKAHFFHTFPAYTAVKVTDMKDNDVQARKAYDKVKVTFYRATGDKALPEGEVKFMILAKSGTQIQDLWGNKFADFATSLKVAADKTAPEVKEVKAADKKKFEITFTKSVTLQPKHIDVLDKDGKAITGLGLTLDKASGEKFVATVLKSLEGQSVTINISGAKDTTLNENKMVDFSAVVDFKDMTPLGLQSASYQAKVGDTPGFVYVFFSDDADPETALNGANYRLVDLSGNLTAFANNPEFYNGNKVVRIMLNKDETVKVGQDMLVMNVKDLAGNGLDKNKVAFANLDTLINPTVQKRVAVDAKTIEVTFNTAIAGIDESKIHGIAQDKIAVVEVSGAKVVVKLKEAMAGATTTSVTQQIGFAAGSVVSILGGKNDEITAADLEDLVKPEFVSIKALSEGKIAVEFSRELKDADKAKFANDFVIIQPNGNIVNPNHATDKFTTDLDAVKKNIVVITFAGAAKEDGQYTVSTHANPVNIVTGTTSKAFAKAFGAQVVFADSTKPTIVSAKLNKEGNGNSIVITLSEKVEKHTSFNSIDATVGSKEAVTLSDDGMTITIKATATTAFTVASTVNFVVDAVKDLAGNGNAASGAHAVTN
ncbi:MAG: Ig-like domain-containing protein [Bacillota bacterium]|nr:Ig-like domain-containing protein [Bacillota bacterium]